MEKIYKFTCNQKERCYIIKKNFTDDGSISDGIDSNVLLSEIRIPFDNLEISGKKIYQLMFENYEIGDHISFVKDEDYSSDSTFDKLYGVLNELISKSQENINSALAKTNSNSSEDDSLQEDESASSKTDGSDYLESQVDPSEVVF